MCWGSVLLEDEEVAWHPPDRWQHIIRQQDIPEYSPLTLTPGSTKSNSLHPSFVTATETISEQLKIGRVRSRRLVSTYIEAIFIPTLLRELFSQPTTVTLQQY